MRLLLAILIPWLQFFTIGKPISGVICLILQITIIGWIPAVIWSVYSLNQYQMKKNNAQMLKTMQAMNQTKNETENNK